MTRIRSNFVVPVLLRGGCNRVTASDVMNLSDVFSVSPRVRALLVHRIHLSDFYVKHKFSSGEISVQDVLKLFQYLSESLWGQVLFLDYDYD